MCSQDQQVISGTLQSQTDCPRNKSWNAAGCIVVKSGAGGFRQASIPTRQWHEANSYACPLNRQSKRQHVPWPAEWISQVSATQELHTAGNDESNIMISVVRSPVWPRTWPAIGPIDTAYHITIADHRNTRIQPVMTLEIQVSSPSFFVIKISDRLAPRPNDFG